jgi:hypothetical protein
MSVSPESGQDHPSADRLSGGTDFVPSMPPPAPSEVGDATEPAAPAPDELSLPGQLGRFEVRRFVGEGSVGS